MQTWVIDLPSASARQCPIPNTMRIIESFSASKTGNPDTNEDRIVIPSGRNNHLVAVIDGATDKHGLTWMGNVTGGAWIANLIAHYLTTIPPKTAPRDSVNQLTELIANEIRRVQGEALPPHLNPCASLCVYDDSLQLVWRVGDTHVNANGNAHMGTKKIDRIVADFRAAMLAANPNQPGDIGRETAMPLLSTQGNLANAEGEFGYGVMNGTPVPNSYIETWRIAPTDEYIILASDGYPDISVPKLEEAEKTLAHALTYDPACTTPKYRGTKGLQPGNQSFDDRSWILIQL